MGRLAQMMKPAPTNCIIGLVLAENWNDNGYLFFQIAVFSNSCWDCQLEYDLFKCIICQCRKITMWCVFKSNVWNECLRQCRYQPILQFYFVHSILCHYITLNASFLHLLIVTCFARIFRFCSRYLNWTIPHPNLSCRQIVIIKPSR